jgi:hypothetical protein
MQYITIGINNFESLINKIIELDLNYLIKKFKYKYNSTEMIKTIDSDTKEDKLYNTSLIPFDENVSLDEKYRKLYEYLQNLNISSVYIKQFPLPNNKGVYECIVYNLIHEYIFGKYKDFDYMYFFVISLSSLIYTYNKRQYGIIVTFNMGKNTLNKEFNKYSSEEIIQENEINVLLLLFLLFYGIYILNHEFKIIHNDLHFENIFLNRLQHPETHERQSILLRLNYEGQNFTLNTKYILSIYDYDMSIIESYRNTELCSDFEEYTCGQIAANYTNFNEIAFRDIVYVCCLLYGYHTNIYLYLRKLVPKLEKLERIFESKILSDRNCFKVCYTELKLCQQIKYDDILNPLIDQLKALQMINIEGEIRRT